MPGRLACKPGRRRDGFVGRQSLVAAPRAAAAHAVPSPPAASAHRAASWWGCMSATGLRGMGKGPCTASFPGCQKAGSWMGGSAAAVAPLFRCSRLPFSSALHVATTISGTWAGAGGQGRLGTKHALLQGGIQHMRRLAGTHAGSTATLPPCAHPDAHVWRPPAHAQRGLNCVLQRHIHAAVAGLQVGRQLEGGPPAAAGGKSRGACMRCLPSPLQARAGSTLAHML